MAVSLPVSANANDKGHGGHALGNDGSTVTSKSGAQFEILVDGKPRSYRDMKAVAMEAAEYLKNRHPHSEVAVKDLRNGEVTVVVYRPQSRYAPAVKGEHWGRKWR